MKQEPHTFATWSVNVTAGARQLVPVYFCIRENYKDNIKLYEVSTAYVDYLAPTAPHLFRNKQDGQQNERKYIGIDKEM